jgi:tRNA A-37 threonylcarbamoyl transferase component Bud32
MNQVNSTDTLKDISYENLTNFSLALPDSNNSETVFQCSRITRCLPGKRISCIGHWQGKTIFAKFFIAPKRAEKHWSKEKKGFHLLNKKEILAPTMLHSGKHKLDDIYFILYELIENSIDLKPLWESSNKSQQIILLHQLMATVAEHHKHGITQQDLHLNNFLVSSNQIFTLDGADITEIDSNAQDIAFNNLALLFAQFYPSNDLNIALAVENYCDLRQWQLTPSIINKIKSSTLLIRNKRKLDRLAKTGRSCSLFYYDQTWDQQTICARKYRSAEMQAFLDAPDSYIKQANLLKDGNTCTVSVVTIDNIDMVVKRYNIKNWQHAFSRAFRHSRAVSSWVSAHLLQFYGIPTPEPVAVIEKRWGPLRKEAYFITKLIFGETGDLYFNSDNNTIDEKRAMAESTVKLLTSIHRLNISHGDLKITNIMISDSHPVIIDLDSMKQHWNQYLFNKAKKRDIKRFLKNWQHNPKLEEIFQSYFLG